MANFMPAPTYAELTETDPVTGHVRLNPLWKRFFDSIAQVFGAIGIGGGPGSLPDHNSLGGLQGGGAGERYHLTAAEHTALGGNDAEAANLVLAQRTFSAPAPALLQDQGILMNQIFGA